MWRRSPRSRPPRGLRRALLLTAAAGATALGCSVPLAMPSHYDYFAYPDPHDAWSPKIAGWQLREAAEVEAATASFGLVPVAGGAAPEPDLVSGRRPADPGASEGQPSVALRTKYALFRAERKRALARDLFTWIQAQAKAHYVPDGPIDHWATLEETLRHDGDDCDGLELLVYNALLELGFANDEVYRAIVYRPSDGQHHMVTLWFEEPNDPWVIDPTGAMTTDMLRMSEIPDWAPLKVFDEDEEFTVRRVSERMGLAAR